MQDEADKSDEERKGQKTKDQERSTKGLNDEGVE